MTLKSLLARKNDLSNPQRQLEHLNGGIFADGDLPKFKDKMLPNEITEMVATSLKNIYGGTIAVETSGLKPTTLGTERGFSFNINFFDTKGLYISGKATATNPATSRRYRAAGGPDIG